MRAIAAESARADRLPRGKRYRIYRTLYLRFIFRLTQNRATVSAGRSIIGRRHLEMPPGRVVRGRGGAVVGRRPGSADSLIAADAATLRLPNPPIPYEKARRRGGPSPRRQPAEPSSRPVPAGRERPSLARRGQRRAAGRGAPSSTQITRYVQGQRSSSPSRQRPWRMRRGSAAVAVRLRPPYSPTRTRTERPSALQARPSGLPHDETGRGGAFPSPGSASHPTAPAN